jgi:hypothetical protein
MLFFNKNKLKTSTNRANIKNNIFNLRSFLLKKPRFLYKKIIEIVNKRIMVNIFKILIVEPEKYKI